jgi:threonine/homoserine/homoserine lactone efflux protein
MSVDHVLAFALVSFALILVPGPSVLFIVGRALSLGRRSALETVAGNAAGEYAQVLAVAFGIGAIVERSVAVFTAVKLVGAAYLVFLGVRAIRTRRSLASVLEQDPVARSRRRVLREGFVVGVSNPKSLAFFVAVLPQFVVPAAGPASLQLLLLGLVWVAVALVSDSSWALLAGQARAWLGRSPRRLETIGATGGVMMVGLGLSLALTARKR